MRAPCRSLIALAAGAALLAGCSADESEAGSGAESPASATPSGTVEPTPAEESTEAASEVDALARRRSRSRSDRGRCPCSGWRRSGTGVTGCGWAPCASGRRQYTSYDVTYRSRSTTPRGEEAYRISGVLNVPTGRGPFPAVVLAHGYIDPAVYVRGQGMTRERGYLAARGYIALHVDYRNHAESDDDPRSQTGCDWATAPT